MRITWFGVGGATYDIDKSTDNETTWVSLETNYSTEELIDATGTISDLYRVRVNGSAIWNPAFTGLVESDVESCLIYGYLRKSDGTPYEGADVYAQAPTNRQFLLDAFYTSNEPIATVSDVDGYWSLYLPIGLSVTVKIPFANVDETVVIPDLPTAPLSSLL